MHSQLHIFGQYGGLEWLVEAVFRVRDIGGLIFDLGILLLNLVLEVAQLLTTLRRRSRLIFEFLAHGIILDLDEIDEQRCRGFKLPITLF